MNNRSVLTPGTDPDTAYQLPVDQAARLLGSAVPEGLSAAEARERLLRVGPNTVPLRSGPAWWLLLLQQFWSPLVAVLAAGALLAFVYHDRVNAYAILVVLLLNALIGFYMDYQARRTIRGLQALEDPLATVYRQEQLLECRAEELVPGDLIRVEAGQRVPADARVVAHTNLGVDESSLTGESGTVAKRTEPLPRDTPLADRRNMLFTGTIVTRGYGTALVTQTGIATELGRGLHLMDTVAEETTPLERKLAALTHRLIWLTLALAGVVVGLGAYRGMDTYLVVETAIALAVAAIPEGLPVVATITLAIGMARLARHKIVIKELRAVETLGETQVLVIDKTGTLTENKLTVESVLQCGPKQGNGQEHVPPGLRQLLQVAVRCNTAVADGEHMVGDPLELALLQYAESAGVAVAATRAEAELVQEQPFSSETRRMVTVHRLVTDDGLPPYLTGMKGAPEAVLERCTDCLRTDGKLEVLDPAYWRARITKGAERGHKTLALAYRRHDTPEVAQELTWLGLLWLHDPPRVDVKQAIVQFRTAGIRLVMATGDHAATARSIALATGLVYDSAATVLTGTEVEDLLRGDGSRAAPAALFAPSIFARVSPAQKLQILHAYQQQGYTVAMAGDGVNDAPALRKAAIGIAMGEGGSQAAKAAADLILQDNSLANVIEAVRQGRGIFANIRLFTVYLLSCNLGELLVVGGAFLFGFAGPLAPVQILFLNLLTDVFPALALGFTRGDPDALRKPPRARGEAILTPALWRSLALYAVAIAGSVLGGVVIGQRLFTLSPAEQNDLMFYALFSAQLWHVLSLPGPRAHLLRHPIVRNPYLGGAVVFCLLLTLAAYLIPVTRTAMQLESGLDWRVLLLAVGIGAFPVLLIRVVSRIIAAATPDRSN
ncbi:Calcium-transporting ATPase 1 [Neolewinella maritima]|uniref:Calcium-transporting ATPase 1 n=1 Tax=Neolewinella maritima TaxID=1383882 RepID=A0ABM9B1B6_9BACT|nr:cation-transporting P-type ATPase [Neolewinella maritima]CAH1000706.1 Calcium-transporting ATPase 1 [Neolewinella maritima]